MRSIVTSSAMAAQRLCFFRIRRKSSTSRFTLFGRGSSFEPEPLVVGDVLRLHILHEELCEVGLQMRERVTVHLLGLPGPMRLTVEEIAFGRLAEEHRIGNVLDTGGAERHSVPSRGLNLSGEFLVWQFGAFPDALTVKDEFKPPNTAAPVESQVRAPLLPRVARFDT